MASELDELVRHFTELLSDSHAHEASLLAEIAVNLAEIDAGISRMDDTLAEIAWYSLPRWVRWREAWRNRGTGKRIKTDMALDGSESHANGLDPQT